MYADIMTSLINLANKLEKLDSYNRAILLDETRPIIKYLQSRNEFITRLGKMAFLSPMEMDYITKDEGKMILRAAELIKELESKKLQKDKVYILFLEERDGDQADGEQPGISSPSPAPEEQIVARSGEVDELARLVERARELVPNLYDSWHQAAEEALASHQRDTNTVEDHETEKAGDNPTCATEPQQERAAEQVVTEAMVEAVTKSLRPDLFTPLSADDLQSDDFARTRREKAKVDALNKVRAALKAAMEAGR